MCIRDRLFSYSTVVTGQTKVNDVRDSERLWLDSEITHNIHSFITDYNLMGLGHLKNRIIVYDRAVYHDILTSSDCFAISNFGSNIYLPHNENSQIRVFSMANPYRGFHGYEVGWVCLEDHPLSNIAQDFMRCFIELTNESLAEKRRLSELTP